MNAVYPPVFVISISRLILLNSIMYRIITISDVKLNVQNTSGGIYCSRNLTQVYIFFTLVFFFQFLYKFSVSHGDFIVCTKLTKFELTFLQTLAA